MTITSYAVGNQITCYFAFTSRALTQAELATFQSGGGLPAGIGIDQTNLYLDYSVNDIGATTLSGSSITRDAQGAYHATITAALPGTYKYRGYSKDSGGNAVASSASGSFIVTPFP